MENMIRIFECEEFGKVRTLKEETGRIVFCGKDVAVALGYSNTKDAIKRHCRWGVKHDLPHPQSPSKTIEMAFIPESDVYRLVPIRDCHLPKSLKVGSLMKYSQQSGAQAVMLPMRICLSKTTFPFWKNRIKVFFVCR